MAFTSRQVCPTYPEIETHDADNPPDVGCTGDINLDGNVTVADTALAVLSEFGCTQSCARCQRRRGRTVTDAGVARIVWNLCL